MFSPKYPKITHKTTLFDLLHGKFIKYTKIYHILIMHWKILSISSVRLLSGSAGASKWCCPLC